MKTLNKIMFVFFALVSVNTISAQQRDTVYVEVLDPDALITLATSPANSITCEHRGCKDGTPWSYNCGGAFLKLTPVYNYSTWESDLGEGSTENYGADITLGWEWCRKGWAIAPSLEGKFGLRTGNTLDGEKNKTNATFGLGAFVKILPHSLRLKLGYEMESISFVTKNAGGDPYRGHALGHGPSIEWECPLGFVNFYHNEKVGNNDLKVKTMNRVSLVAGANVKFYNCNKYWTESSTSANPNIKVTQWTFHVGLKYNFHL